ncbi:hypothetical protein [Pseudomonas sp.]|uniref:hypothetical protein n=1 Tax=Pseudomonas sp. TaxID=306 RepID=UPI00260EE33C|nr:hypothetical protein [Pseudomonas sp.]
MRLVHCRKLKMGDEKYVYPPAEAIALIKSAVARYQKIEGLAELRRGLMINLDHMVWQQIERGEWLLIKPEARSFDWKDFEPEARHRRMLAAMENPPPQITPAKLIFRLFDSETAEFIFSRKYFGKFDGESGERRVDAQGFGTFPVISKKASLSVRLGGRY